jgi:hypothetical protein
LVLRGTTAVIRSVKQLPEEKPCIHNKRWAP